MDESGGSILPMLAMAFAVVGAVAVGLAYLLAAPLRRALGPSARLVLGGLAALALAFALASFSFARRSGIGWWMAHGEETAFWALALALVLAALAWRAGKTGAGAGSGGAERNR